MSAKFSRIGFPTKSVSHEFFLTASRTISLYHVITVVIMTGVVKEKKQRWTQYFVNIIFKAICVLFSKETDDQCESIAHSFNNSRHYLVTLAFI